MTLLNATPDFVISKDSNQASVVGEIESSPYIQMLVAGLGHISEPFVKYTLGIVISKDCTVAMYLIENDLSIKLTRTKNTREV